MTYTKNIQTIITKTTIYNNLIYNNLYRKRQSLNYHQKID